MHYVALCVNGLEHATNRDKAYTQRLYNVRISRVIKVKSIVTKDTHLEYM